MTAPKKGYAKTAHRYAREHDKKPVFKVILPCGAYQASDQVLCPCGMVWDMNDPEPPICPRTLQPARNGNRP